ncbi:VirD4-like conjugal transfer protein, CD1115 family [Agathobaculum hominis]|uniref:Type IV secretory system conjugative DNA transfer family protein n=1 Tax=Agathobaculum hominis TaxID=2763014 RepID=A0ABR7GJZ8_9FIRM|nr:type IV secretory system conjugative DNA transfer family protein [Agathobaculum hominis]MBC5694606.1 type IV secretory system conjugative DNA transfer family protein [Agathobaculum hominis]
MTPLSERIAKLEQRLNKRLERWKAKHSADWRLHAVLGGMGWYFYGMIVNSVRLGIRQSFNAESDIASIWVVNPFRNLIAPFTLTGLGLTAALLVLACLLTRRGFNWLSGYHPVHDKRGFDILPDGTHGTSRFMKPEEMKAVLETGRLDDLTGTIYGKHRDDPLDDNRFSLYIASSSKSGLAGNMLVIGAPGTGKSWGFVRPMIFQCVKRRESMILTDPKAELYESTAGYLADMGYEVRVFNLLEMEHSDRWNCIGEADYDERLIPIIAATIINNTSSEKEAGDFWAKAELNLLTALLYYVQNDKDVSGNVLPLSQRRLGRILSLLTDNGLATIDREIKLLPAGHPAKGPYGLFLQAKENIRGNIVIGLGNRLNVFQDKLVDALTADSTIDLTLPGHRPCAYFCILSAQDHTYAFLSSLFFTMIFSRLEQYARRETEDGKLPVPVNFVLDEFPSIGKLGDFKRSIAFTRGFRMNCIVIVQSIAQLADIYPRREWEEITACCDATICLGVNDTTSAQFVSEKCGMTTIRVTNNQQPQTPLFSPVANLSRPYSQTRSNTQRALMQPDEVLRLDNAKSIVMLRGQLPMLLYKVMPPEFADFKKLRTLSIAKYHGKTDEVEEEPRKTQTKQPKQSAAQAVYANLLHFEKEEGCSAPALTAQQLQEIQDALNKGEKDI